MVAERSDSEMNMVEMLVLFFRSTFASLFQKNTRIIMSRSTRSQKPAKPVAETITVTRNEMVDEKKPEVIYPAVKANLNVNRENVPAAISPVASEVPLFPHAVEAAAALPDRAVKKEPDAKRRKTTAKPKVAKEPAANPVRPRRKAATAVENNVKEEPMDEDEEEEEAMPEDEEEEMSDGEDEDEDEEMEDEDDVPMTSAKAKRQTAKKTAAPAGGSPGESESVRANMNGNYFCKNTAVCAQGKAFWKPEDAKKHAIGHYRDLLAEFADFETHTHFCFECAVVFEVDDARMATHEHQASIRKIPMTGKERQQIADDCAAAPVAEIIFKEIIESKNQ